MAGAFSSHLLEQFADHGNSTMMTDGGASFDVSMHGTNPFGQRNMSMYSQPFTPFREGPSYMSQDSAEKLSRIQAKLNQKLGPEFLSQRPGPGGGPKLTYVEGWKVINLANEVFGFNGWSSSIVRLNTDFIDYSHETKRFNVGVTAIMRVTLRDGIFHEDVGFGFLENSRSKAAAIDKCNKEAVTDGLKRALRNFGNILGNCLYDKSYTADVMKVKAEPAKFREEELHRRPEYNAFTPTHTSDDMRPGASPMFNPNRTMQSTPIRPQPPAKPLSAVPPHMRPSGSVNAGPSYPRPANPPQQQTTASTSSPKLPMKQTNPQAPGQKPIPQPQPIVAAPVTKPEPVQDEFDAFAISAEDEAMFAAADLGPAMSLQETDIGQPIRPDEDLGQPIDQDEGLLAALNEMEENERMKTERPVQIPNSKPVQSMQQKPPQRQAKPPSEARTASKTREEIIAEALKGSMSDPTPSMHPKPPSPAPQPVPPSLPGQHQRVQANTRSLVQQNHQRYMIMKEEQQRQMQMQGQTDNSASVSTSRDQDQNRNPYTGSQHPHTGSAQHSASSSGLNSRPSMGGFNFPPGVTSALQSGSSGSGIGMKRPADAMNSSRGGRPGMGLEHATAGVGVGQMKRTVLGEIGENNDPKRMKR
ncbi:hypothetical protein CVT24_009298 [Panaeolus cyanescens]|uniref:Uncharacterized protein n=1 Tax=Panaeolus cyanescens TaxID=181874 RepID=A0A409Y8P3_9AGAR|nr:hypothetical protein CVT24_009298 [Panaeolus cyanescens]